MARRYHPLPPTPSEWSSASLFRLWSRSLRQAVGSFLDCLPPLPLSSGHLIQGCVVLQRSRVWHSLCKTPKTQSEQSTIWQQNSLRSSGLRPPPLTIALRRCTVWASREPICGLNEWKQGSCLDQVRLTWLSWVQWL